MFPTEVIWRWALRDRSGRTGRIARVGAISLGLGISTAVAAELTITPGAPADETVGAVATFPQGWSYFDPGFLVDHLPFKLTIGQSISYNDNVGNLPQNVGVLVNNNRLTRLPSRGDFYSDTTINIASRFPMGVQTFFFNGTYAPRQYFTDTALNANNYSINGGVDFSIANRCSGRLVAGIDQHQSPLYETAGIGVQDSTATSFNEIARCVISGHVAGLFNSGVSRIENSGSQLAGLGAISSALNNYDQQYVGGGLEYSLSSLDTLRGLATFTHRDFPNRPAGLGLSRETDQQDYQAVYSRVFSAKLDGSVTGGLSVFSLPGSSDAVEPIYSFQLNYRPTPKIVASGIVARSAGAPQSAISNFQVSDTQSVSLTYNYSPKLNVSGVYSHGTSRNPGAVTPLGLQTLLFTNTNTNNASVVVNYRATPLLSATAAYSYVSRTDASRLGLDAVSNVFRVGLIYTR